MSKEQRIKYISLDFRRAQVRKSTDQGKTWTIMIKYELYQMLRTLDQVRYAYADTIYNYEQLKNLLYKEAKENKHEGFRFLCITKEED